MASSKANALYILVSDVEAHAVGPVTPHLDRGDVTTDCLGRGWVTDAVGKRLLEAAEAAWQDELRLQGEHRAYLADRQARRQALSQKIQQDLGGGATPESAARVFSARQAALIEFDEREGPELGYWEWLEKKRPTMAAAR